MTERELNLLLLSSSRVGGGGYLDSARELIGEMFAEFANFKYPTSIQRMSITVSANLKSELDNADKHGTVPNTVAAEFDFTTYTSRK